ncbi:MAG: S1 family peptidase [Geminicoccaceae bacterium]
MRCLPLAFGLAFLLGCAGHDAPPSKNEVIAHTLATTVQLVAERPNGARRSGSAVLLGDGSGGRTFVVTAHHVLAPEAEQRLAVHFPQRQRRADAVLLASDPDLDLALLAASGPADAEVRLRQEAFLGDEVWVVAFPWGRRRTVVKGVVSQIDAPAEEARGAVAIGGPIRLIDASVSYGMSGGGVFDARTGDLLGIVRGYRTAQLSVQGSDAQPLQVPLAGETTVISAAQIACFLAANGFAHLIPAEASSAQCRAQ